MDQRIVEFVAALRASGVRVSIAESEDAFRAVQHIGIRDRRRFRDALRTTLVKEAHHQYCSGCCMAQGPRLRS